MRSAKVKGLAAVYALIAASASAALLSCSEDELGDIRLVNGRTSRDGQVEVCLRTNQTSRIRGTAGWGVLCDEPWSDRDAAVACRQLGFSDIGAVAGGYDLANENANAAGVRRTDFPCSGTEEKLLGCGLIDWSCESQRASVSCQTLPGEEPPSCHSSLFECANKNCVHDAEEQVVFSARPGVCNGRDDCFDCSDECQCGDSRDFSIFPRQCRARSTTVCECNDQEFQCANGFCVSLNLLCDGTSQCGDSSDEVISTCQRIAIQRGVEVEEAVSRAVRSTLLGVLVPLGVVVGAWLLLLASCLLLPACPLRRAWSGKTTPTGEDHNTPLAAAL